MAGFKPAGVSSEVFTPDKLQVTGPYAAKGITIEEDSAAADLSRGRLMAKSGSKHVPLDAAETTVALNAVLFKDDFGAGASVGPWVFTLANPPIPGTLRVVTVDQGTTTVVLDCGTDNGEGVGSGAGGTFTVDYETGLVTVMFATAPSDDDDGTFTYKHRGAGLPDCILAEDVSKAELDEDDIVSLGYTKGTFLASALTGYSAGYKLHLRKLGIELE